MIAYFDTSAFVPLLVDEPTSASCREIWAGADKRISTRLLYVEASAALEAATRAGSLSRSQATNAFEKLGRFWEAMQVWELDERLMQEASAWARRFGLRGYDSVHCAAAAQLLNDGVVAVSGDKSLNQAWSTLGVAVFNPSSDTKFRAERQAATAEGDQPEAID